FVLATIHPSAVLRAPDDETRERWFAGLVADLAPVASMLHEPESRAQAQRAASLREPITKGQSSDCPFVTFSGSLGEHLCRRLHGPDALEICPGLRVVAALVELSRLLAANDHR